jgi:mannose-6-phosphate isomerase-like protein (cupin superfamily)
MPADPDPPRRGVIVLPGEGARYGNVEFLAQTEDTPRFTLGVIEIAAGREVGVHVHADEDDAFYILAGELTFTLDGEQAVASAGTFVLAPPGLPHGFVNAGQVPVRMLNIHAPAGFDLRVAAS